MCGNSTRGAWNTCRQSDGSGGEGGIRTHGTRKGTTVFETARFNHSRTSPGYHYNDSNCTNCASESCPKAPIWIPNFDEIAKTPTLPHEFTPASYIIHVNLLRFLQEV